MRVERSMIHGWGVVAVKEISRGELVVEYIGQVIRKPVSVQHSFDNPFQNELKCMQELI